jgi:hypothetical protein
MTVTAGIGGMHWMQRWPREVPLGLKRHKLTSSSSSTRLITSLNADLSNKETSAHLVMRTTFEISANGPLFGRAQADRQQLRLSVCSYHFSRCGDFRRAEPTQGSCCKTTLKGLRPYQYVQIRIILFHPNPCKVLRHTAAKIQRFIRRRSFQLTDR